MRTEMGNTFAGAGCSFTDGISTSAVAAVYYDGADTDSVPNSVNGLSTADLNNCPGDALPTTQSLCPVPLAGEDEVSTVVLDFDFAPNATVDGTLVWTVNGQQFHADMGTNILEEVIAGTTTFANSSNVFSFDSSKKAIRVHMRNHFAAGHPMHLHGHDFNVLAAGVGVWDGTITNPDNTQVRDVQGLPPYVAAIDQPGFLVIQFNQDNPGVWPLHCHIAWHVSQGLYLNILEKPESIKYKIPGPVKETCNDYNDWITSNVPFQIDSGV